MNPLMPALVAGLATGGRSMTPLALLALTAPAGSDRLPDRVFAVPWVRGFLGLLAVGELVGDKLPVTPSRTMPVVFATRLLTAAGCGVVIARRQTVDSGDPREPLPQPPPASGVAAAVVTAVGGAALSSVAGTRWRGLASRRFGQDWVGAVLEDLGSVGAGSWAAGRVDKRRSHTQVGSTIG